MPVARKSRRIRNTRELFASLRPAGENTHEGAVLNLSEGGMLIAGDGLTVGEKADFELSGPSFHYAGVAEVAHLTAGATGLRFLSWQEHDDRPFRSLLAEMSDWKPPTATPERDRAVLRRVAVLVGAKRSAPKDGPPPAA